MKYLLIGVLLISSCSSTLGQKSNWYVPDFYTLQYAGSIGFISAGAGYELPGNQSRLSIHYGYVPRAQGGPFHIGAARFMHSAWVISHKSVQVRPFDAGVFVSYHFGEEFNSTWPDRYPDGYYWWKNSIRLHLAIEQSLTVFPKTGFIRRASLFMEYNTNDLYLVSYVQNTRSLSLRDILKTGMGLRLTVGKR